MALAPISNTEIVFLRFNFKEDPMFGVEDERKMFYRRRGNKIPDSGVAIFDVATNTITNVA